MPSSAGARLAPLGGQLMVREVAVVHLRPPGVWLHATLAHGFLRIGPVMSSTRRDARARRDGVGLVGASESLPRATREGAGGSLGTFASGTASDSGSISTVAVVLSSGSVP